MLYYIRTQDGCVVPVAEGTFPHKGETLIIRASHKADRKCFKCGNPTERFT